MIRRALNDCPEAILWYMARNASHFAANWPTSRSNEFRQKIKKKKKKWRRPTHGFLYLNLKSLIRQAHKRSCQLLSFRLGFFKGDQSGQLHDEKLPNSYSPVVFSVSAQTSLKRYSERLLLFKLSSSLSRIDDVFVNFGEKKVTTRTLHCDAKTSFHLNIVAYDHARTDSVPSQGRRHLELCRSVDCVLAPRFLAPVHVYIYFQAYWACLIVIETNEKPV